MKSLAAWLEEYGESHQNGTNKLIHWVCVPAIFFSITGLLYEVPLPPVLGKYHFRLAEIVMVLLTVYYLFLSRTIWIGMLLFGIGCLFLCRFIESLPGIPLGLVCLITFVLAWIGQFYGHKIEGKKPSFLKDIQFLLIGPAWLMHFIYRRFGIPL